MKRDSQQEASLTAMRAEEGFATQMLNDLYNSGPSQRFERAPFTSYTFQQAAEPVRDSYRTAGA